jgi:hypothetical protein
VWPVYSELGKDRISFRSRHRAWNGEPRHCNGACFQRERTCWLLCQPCHGPQFDLNGHLRPCCPWRNASNWYLTLASKSTIILIISYCLVQLLAHFPRSLRCGDRVWLQDYFCRAGGAPGRRTIDRPCVKTPKGRSRRGIVFLPAPRFTFSLSVACDEIGAGEAVRSTRSACPSVLTQPRPIPGLGKPQHVPTQHSSSARPRGDAILIKVCQ